MSDRAFYWTLLVLFGLFPVWEFGLLYLLNYLGWWPR